MCLCCFGPSGYEDCPCPGGIGMYWKTYTIVPYRAKSSRYVCLPEIKTYCSKESCSSSIFLSTDVCRSLFSTEYSMKKASRTNATKMLKDRKRCHQVATVQSHDKTTKSCKKLHFSYFIMMMTTTMWKRTKKILADTWLTEVKPLLSSGTTIRNNSLHASWPSRPRPQSLSDDGWS